MHQVASGEGWFSFKCWETQAVPSYFCITEQISFDWASGVPYQFHSGPTQSSNSFSHWNFPRHTKRGGFHDFYLLLDSCWQLFTVLLHVTAWLEEFLKVVQGDQFPYITCPHLYRFFKNHSQKAWRDDAICYSHFGEFTKNKAFQKLRSCYLAHAV